jgi:hypothetical protein
VGPRKGARIRSVPQQEQRCELSEEAGRLDGRRHQDEARVQQGKPAVHDLEQVIEDDRQRDIGHGDHQVRGEAEPVQQLVRLDVVGRGCRIARDDQHGGHDADGEGAAKDVDQVQRARKACQLARRRTRNGIHQ